MKITDKDIQDYWIKFDYFIIRWFCVSLFYVLSIIALLASLILGILNIDWYYWQYWLIPYGATIPLAILFKYGFGWKGIWLFNDTKDGDTGDPKEIEKAGLTGKPLIVIIIWWWFRNHSWNFNRKYKPNWLAGYADKFLIIYTTLTKEQIENNRWQWCSKNGVYGKHYVVAIIDGKIECRFSEATDKYQRQMGSGGNEYRFRFKGFWYIIGIMISRQFKRLFKK